MSNSGGNPHGLGIDHLLFLTDDLVRYAETFRKLGFTVTPRGLHSPHLGSANHTIMFDDDYVELIGVERPTPHNQLHRDNLRLGEGLHTIALRTDFIAGTAEALRAAGIETDTPVKFSRPVNLPDGSTADAAFEVIRPARSALPDGFMFYCHHLTPEAVWVAEWMTHANGTRRIAAVVMSCEDPNSMAQRYLPLFADARLEPIEGGIRLPTGKAELEFLTPRAVEALYATADCRAVGAPLFKVARFGTDDLQTVRTVLSGNGIPIIDGPTGSVLVPPAYCGGTVIEFV